MTVRTFLAVDLKEGLRDALLRFQNKLRNDLPSLAWVKPGSIHLTLKFLGDIPLEQSDIIQEGVRESVRGQDKFSLEVQGLGVFPNARMPRTLWVGISGNLGLLVQVVDRIDAKLETLGFSRELRPYHPHLTLGRIKNESREMGKALAAGGVLDLKPSLGPLEINRISLFKSELKSEGSVYTPLWEVPLGDDHLNEGPIS